METMDKEILKKFKKEIAELAKEQKTIKPQRKTVHFTGERTLSPSDAYWKVRNNKHDLRCMYAAYNLLRGKNFEFTENNAKPINDEDYWYLNGRYPSKDIVGKHPLVEHLDDINKYLNKYGYEIPNTVEKYKDWFGRERERIKFDIDNYEKIICINK